MPSILTNKALQRLDKLTKTRPELIDYKSTKEDFIRAIKTQNMDDFFAAVVTSLECGTPSFDLWLIDYLFQHLDRTNARRFLQEYLESYLL